MPTEPLAEYTGTELDVMSFAANYHRWILDEFAPYLGKDVAEVGAGIGSVSRMLLQRPIERLVAFEPSSNMFPHLETELSGVACATAVKDFFGLKHADGGFDSVVYINVMEHIENDWEEMTTACAALRPGGHLLVFVPALPFLYSDFDKSIGHFRRYTKRVLRDTAQKAGLAPVKLHYFDIAGILPWYVNFKLLRRSMAGSSVSLYDKFVVPPMRVVEGMVTPPIGKNLLMVAKKR